MNIIYDKTDIMKFISTGYYTSGDSVLKSQERGSLILHQEKKQFKKRAKQIISRISKDFTLAVEDESIFVHDALIRKRMWTPDASIIKVKYVLLRSR